jgi:hypothetical protein
MEFRDLTLPTLADQLRTHSHDVSEYSDSIGGSLSALLYWRTRHGLASPPLMAVAV